MKTKLMITILICSIQCIAQEFKALDDKNGFRNFIFGTDIASYKSMSQFDVSNDGLTKYYFKTDDKLTIGINKLEGIAYGFYKGKLSTIVIKTKGSENSHGVFASLREMYGSSWAPDEYTDQHHWLGKVVRMTYEETLNGDATVIMMSESIIKQIKKDEAAANKKSKSDW